MHSYVIYDLRHAHIASSRVVIKSVTIEQQFDATVFCCAIVMFGARWIHTSINRRTPIGSDIQFDMTFDIFRLVIHNSLIERRTFLG